MQSGRAHTGGLPFTHAARAALGLLAQEHRGSFNALRSLEVATGLAAPAEWPDFCRTDYVHGRNGWPPGAICGLP